MGIWMRIAALLLAAVSTSLLPGAVRAQDNSDQTESRAFLVTPLSFVKELDLDFGQIIPGSSDGTVVMDSAGTVTTTGGVLQIGGTQQPARFWGYGAFNQRVLMIVQPEVWKFGFGVISHSGIPT